MNITLQRELEQIESDIKSSIISGDSFEYQKLLWVKQETTDKLFFAETKNLRAEIESATSERQAAFAVLDDLTAELKAQAEKVFEARSRTFDEQEKHNAINARLHFLRTKIESDRETINDLQRKLDLAVNKKLHPENYDESGNLKRTVTNND